MAIAELVDEQILIKTDWSEKDLVKLVPGVRWDNQHKLWKAYLSWATCVTLRGVFRNRLEVGPKLADWSWRERGGRVEPSFSIRNALGYYDPVLDPNNDHDTRLFPFQLVGRDWLCVAGDALLGDEMGVGKTTQVLAAMRRQQQLTGDVFPALVICPNTVKHHWERHIQGDAFTKPWLPEATPYVVTGGAVARRKVLAAAAEDPTAVVIINFESIRLFSRLAPYGNIKLLSCSECDKRHGDPTITTVKCQTHRKEFNGFGFKTCVLDEAHRVKDPKAQQTRAVWATLHDPSVLRRWGTTGTPLAQHLGDVWSIMHALAPYDFPVKSTFTDRFALMSWNAFGGMEIAGLKPETRDEFFAFFDSRFRRMTKAMVLPQLPPKVRTPRTVEMTPKQKKAYVDMEERNRTILEDGTFLIAKKNLSARVRMLQLASSYCEVDYGDNPDDMDGWTVTLKEPSPKVDELVELLRELDGAPVAVAAMHRQLIDLAATRLEAEKIPFVLITGTVPEGQRALNLETFRNGGVNVIMFTFGAGGTGLDMTRAGTMIRLQRSWSMIENIQGEDRVHRIGSEQHTSVNYIDLITSGTVEDRQLERLYERLERLEEITRDRQRLVAMGQSTVELDREYDEITKSDLF